MTYHLQASLIRTVSTAVHMFKGQSVASYAGPPVLNALEFKAMPTTTDPDYDQMKEACCRASEPFFAVLEQQGYKRWLFSSALVSQDYLAQHPSHRVASLIEKKLELAGESREWHSEEWIWIEATTFMPKTPYPNKNRALWSGLYDVTSESVLNLVRFLFLHGPAVLFLSKRPLLSSDTYTDPILKAARRDLSGMGLGRPNWPSLARTLCPLSDVVVRTLGGFEDLSRTVCMVATPDTLGMVFGAEQVLQAELAKVGEGSAGCL